jgi:hypothetical protein
MRARDRKVQAKLPGLAAAILETSRPRLIRGRHVIAEVRRHIGGGVVVEVRRATAEAWVTELERRALTLVGRQRFAEKRACLRAAAMLRHAVLADGKQR